MNYFFSSRFKMISNLLERSVALQFVLMACVAKVCTWGAYKETAVFFTEERECS